MQMKTRKPQFWKRGSCGNRSWKRQSDGIWTEAQVKGLGNAEVTQRLLAV